MNATEHLLTILAEECAEVAKDVSKALRFGLDEVNVAKPGGPNNRERIEAELSDLLAVVEMLMSSGVLSLRFNDSEAKQQKKGRVAQFMEYARRLGTLTE